VCVGRESERVCVRVCMCRKREREKELWLLNLMICKFRPGSLYNILQYIEALCLTSSPCSTPSFLSLSLALSLSLSLSHTHTHTHTHILCKSCTISHACAFFLTQSLSLSLSLCLSLPLPLSPSASLSLSHTSYISLVNIPGHGPSHSLWDLQCWSNRWWS
jgi:hypothetical protein